MLKVLGKNMCFEQKTTEHCNKKFRVHFQIFPPCDQPCPAAAVTAAEWAWAGRKEIDLKLLMSAAHRPPGWPGNQRGVALCCQTVTGDITRPVVQQKVNHLIIGK